MTLKIGVDVGGTAVGRTSVAVAGMGGGPCSFGTGVSVTSGAETVGTVVGIGSSVQATVTANKARKMRREPSRVIID